MARSRRLPPGEARFALIAPATAVVVYLPVLLVPYAFMDDYYVLAWAEGLAGEFFKAATSFGRPLHALALKGGFSLAWDIDSLRLVRLVALLGLMALAVLLYVALRQAGAGRWLSTGICVSVVTLASFQVYVSWAAVFEAPYVAVLAGLAWFLTRSAFGLSGRAAVLRAAIGGAVLLCALLVYQPAAMFFWVFAAIDLLRPGEELRRAWRRFALSLGVAGVAMFFAYAAVRIGVHYYGGATSGRTNLVHDVVAKARWFWNEPIVNGFGMFGLLPGESVALALVLVAAVGIVLLHSESRANAVGFLALGLCLVPLSYLPNLAVSEQFASYRSIGALATLLTLYVWFGLWGIARSARGELLLPLALLAGFAAAGLVVVPLVDPDSAVSFASLTSWPELAVVGVLSVAFAVAALRPRATVAVAVGAAFVLGGAAIAARNVTTLVVAPQSAELQLLRSQLEQPPAPRRVVFVKPNTTDAAAPLIRYDEFGPPSTYFAWVPPPAVLLVLDGRADPAIEVRAWDERAPRPGPGGAFVDMRTLDERRIGWTLWTVRGYDSD